MAVDSGSQRPPSEPPPEAKKGVNDMPADAESSADTDNATSLPWSETTRKKKTKNEKGGDGQ